MRGSLNEQANARIITMRSGDLIQEPNQLIVTRAMRSNNVLTAALAYATAGIPVLAIWWTDGDGNCACGNADCANPGKHPIGTEFPHGHKDATTSPRRIQSVWHRYPQANVAVVPSGSLAVIDIDTARGEAAVAKLKLPPTACVRTGRGRHLYFHANEDIVLPKLEGVDYRRNATGYVLAPPSRHPSGAWYEWDRSPLEAARIEDMRKRKRVVPVDFSNLSVTAREGERNSQLTSIAGSLRRSGLQRDLMQVVLQALNERICKPPLDVEEVRRIARSVAKYDAPQEDGPLFGPPKQRTPLPMEWLWYPYIPRYGMTLVAGDPGIGKSMLMAMLIGAVTSGSTLPMSSEKVRGRRVLVLSAEDNWARVTLPRLMRYDVDVDQMHIMHSFRSLTDERLALLGEEIKTWLPELVVIDTVSAFMGGGRDMHRQNEVGEFLATLTEFAEATGAAIVGLGHLNKQSKEHPLYRVVGSIGFMASIRSALFYGTDPDDPSRLALAHGKANASERGRTIVFEKVGGGRKEVPKLKAVGFSDADESAVCAVQSNPVGRPPIASVEAIEFVLSFLVGKLVPWSKVQAAAEARSIASAGTLNAVRAQLADDGRIVQVGKGPSTRWRLGDEPDADRSE